MTTPRELSMTEARGLLFQYIRLPCFLPLIRELMDYCESKLKWFSHLCSFVIWALQSTNA
jgi:hypothetical protein